MQHCKHESIWELPTSLMPVLQHSLVTAHPAMHSASSVAKVRGVAGGGEGGGGEGGDEGFLHV